MIRGTTVLGVGSSAGPPSAIPLDFARGFGKTGQAFSKSARRGAPPVIFGTVKKNPRYIKVAYPPLFWLEDSIFDCFYVAVDQFPQARLSVLTRPAN